MACEVEKKKSCIFVKEGKMTLTFPRFKFSSLTAMGPKKICLERERGVGGERGGRERERGEREREIGGGGKRERERERERAGGGGGGGERD